MDKDKLILGGIVATVVGGFLFFRRKPPGPQQSYNLYVDPRTREVFWVSAVNYRTASSAGLREMTLAEWVALGNITIYHEWTPKGVLYLDKGPAVVMA